MNFIIPYELNKFSNLFSDNWLKKVESSFYQCFGFINQISQPFSLS